MLDVISILTEKAEIGKHILEVLCQDALMHPIYRVGRNLLNMKCIKYSSVMMSWF